MFDIDKWQEIFLTIKQNKLRTFLTGFAVAWGIFMLMILLGSGNGLSNGVSTNFEGHSKNAIWVWGRETSLAYEGMKPGRRIKFTLDDLEEVKKIPNIVNWNAQIWIGDQKLSFGSETGTYSVTPCLPARKIIDQLDIMDGGRFLNDIDIANSRKVIVIGDDIRKAFFKGLDPIGQYVKVGNIAFVVVGVYKENDSRDGNRDAYIPLTTGQNVYRKGSNIINEMSFNTADVTKDESLAIEAQIRKVLSERQKFDVKDDRAIGIYNSLEGYIQTMNIFKAIKIFIWLIGIGTLIAGIVGVSNIMLIVVKERTREIGVRKAIGATPGSVIGLVLMEAILITGIAGFIGMTFGIGLMEGVNFVMEQAAKPVEGSDVGRMTMFKNPTVDINIAIGATVLLVIAGTIAGYIPAKRAASIKPIDALRDE